MAPKLSILIATVGERDRSFQTLISELHNQAQVYKGGVEVLVYWNNFEKPLFEIREALVHEAAGEYVCFVDDDDLLPRYYCDRIMQAVESSPDYVGWRMQTWVDGVALKPTYHSIKHPSWLEDDNGYYRNISHLNPIKRSIAIQVPFRGGNDGEDIDWANRVAPLVKTEEYIPNIMYYYYYRSGNGSVWRGKPLPTLDYLRPPLPEYCRYHPDSKTFFDGKAELKRLAI